MGFIVELVQAALSVLLCRQWRSEVEAGGSEH
jgi:hypothetical protein